MEWFRACFAELEDPRTGNAQRHELDEIVMIALLATLCGAEGCVDMALFGRSKEPLLRQFLRLPGGVPSHDTFSRIFRLLDPLGFEACFARYLAALSERVQGVVALDGKTVRRSFDRQQGRAPLHLISAWACETRLVLGQLRVDGKSNEIPAVPELLALLAVDGCIVTADAMHAQKATAQAILDRGGDYVLALKANRPALFEDVRLLLDDPAATADAVASTTDGDHGRIETRRADIIHDVAWLAETHGFPGLKAIGKVTATRAQGGQATTASRYYLLSRRLTAARFLEVVRTHLADRELPALGAGRGPGRGPGPRPQGSCARKSRPSAPLRPQRPARQPHQGSTRGKIKRAGWDDAFLLNLLASA